MPLTVKPGFTARLYAIADKRHERLIELARERGETASDILDHALGAYFAHLDRSRKQRKAAKKQHRRQDATPPRPGGEHQGGTIPITWERKEGPKLRK